MHCVECPKRRRAPLPLMLTCWSIRCPLWRQQIIPLVGWVWRALVVGLTPLQGCLAVGTRLRAGPQLMGKHPLPSLGRLTVPRRLGRHEEDLGLCGTTEICRTALYVTLLGWSAVPRNPPPCSLCGGDRRLPLRPVPSRPTAHSGRGCSASSSRQAGPRHPPFHPAHQHPGTSLSDLYPVSGRRRTPEH